MRNLFLWAVIVSGFVTINSCGAKQRATKGGLQGEISISGAFALYPLAVKWADEFQNLHPGVRIDISAGGAGKGMTDVLANVVDLGMVSREIYPPEIEKGAIAFAVAKDAVVATINAQNPDLKDLLKTGLTRDVAIKLWITGEYKTWGQISGSTNTDAVHVYTRSDACGAAETWALWMGKKQEDLSGTGVFGDPGLATAIQKDVLGIGLNNIGYVYDEASRKPNPGMLPLPIDVNNNGVLDPDEVFYDTKDNLIKAIGEDRYPSPPARDLYLVSKGKPAKPEVVEFIKYVLSEGQKNNIPAGYISIPKEKLQRGLRELL
ncbi:MAG: PstS family phosphate ABC transporter substrate-binding protein [Prevotellaceae bacterium]|jgi:phosphate transport system substrate-binding protein|nr:PstS family phosphate ABC transporter substrate-binding protein [Prevotellaceae bacterium]